MLRSLISNNRTNRFALTKACLTAFTFLDISDLSRVACVDSASIVFTHCPPQGHVLHVRTFPRLAKPSTLEFPTSRATELTRNHWSLLQLGLVTSYPSPYMWGNQCWGNPKAFTAEGPHGTYRVVFRHTFEQSDNCMSLPGIGTEKKPVFNGSLSTSKPLLKVWTVRHEHQKPPPSLF